MSSACRGEATIRLRQKSVPPDLFVSFILIYSRKRLPSLGLQEGEAHCSLRIEASQRTMAVRVRGMSEVRQYSWTQGSN